MWVAEERVGGLGVSAYRRVASSPHNRTRPRPRNVSPGAFEVPSIQAPEVFRYWQDLTHALEIEDDEDEYEEDDCEGTGSGFSWRYPPSALKIFVPSGLPKPVVASQPAPALKEPLFPETISRKAVGFW
jgi:hypothetical protein